MASRRFPVTRERESVGWQVKSAAMERATRRLVLCHSSLTYLVRGANNFHAFHLPGLTPSHRVPWNHLRVCSTSEFRCLHILLLLGLQSNQRGETCLTCTSRRKQRIQHSKDKDCQNLDALTIPMFVTVAAQPRKSSGRRYHHPYIIDFNGT